jgi:hypothetical protein
MTDSWLRLAVGAAEDNPLQGIVPLNPPERKRGREISRPRRSGRISEDWEILQNQRHAVNQKLHRDMSFL